MADKPEALIQRLEKLGQDGVGNYGMPICVDAAAELRRLHAVNQELRKALNKLVDHIDFIPTDPYYRNETKELMDAARAAIAKAKGQA
jgi:hypothetical protein